MKKVLYLNSAYQADVTEVEQAEWSGGDGFSLDEVLQDIRRRRLDITIVLTHTDRDRYTNLKKLTCMIQHITCLTLFKHPIQSHKNIASSRQQRLFVFF